MTESNAQDQPGQGPVARRGFIRDLLKEAGEDGLSGGEIHDRMRKAGLVTRRQTVHEDLGVMSRSGLVEQLTVAGAVHVRWVLVSEREPWPLDKWERNLAGLGVVAPAVREWGIVDQFRELVESMTDRATELPVADQVVEMLTDVVKLAAVARTDAAWGQVGRKCQDVYDLYQESKVGASASRGSRERAREIVVDRIGELNSLIDAGAAEENDLIELAKLEHGLADLDAEVPVAADGPNRVAATVAEVPDAVPAGWENAHGDEDRAEAGGHTLVLPFVVCKSEGGPYDDEAFVSGVQLGEILVKLAALKALGGLASERFWVTRTLRKQLDMAAMLRGFTMDVEEVDDPECESMWVWFERDED